ncbi:antichymotrypsin-2-like [Contarinia nasturtii]|uniref:antichymotrypsin-2-like n=1 Tax=Contarinia nasturtii TaxID=265458 RepID=UPI0012D465F3|nr:antichymotrypsin-2-like [Contarinia nasturtii]
MSLLNSTPKIQLNELTNSFGTFTIDLYQQCVQHSVNENVFLSPLSILSALALLSQATEGNTFNEMINSLHLNENKTAVANQINAYNTLIQNGAGQSTLSIANQIYVKQGYSLNPHFKEVAEKQFSSGVESINFENGSEAAQIINHFVEEKTHDKINNLVTPESIDSSSAVVLVNAIYFKGNWKNRFDKEQTKKRDFYISETETVSVDFMQITSNFKFRRSDELDADVLELKYADSKFSFLIVLPRQRTGLSVVESKLKNYDIAKVTNGYPYGFEVIMPKFKIEYEVNLNEILKNLGMSEMFDAHKANLSGLLETPEKLFVSDVVHKAFIEITEEGSEAAAATIVGITLISYPPQPVQPLKFIVDHPFMYYIWDTETKTALFAGRITNFK